MLSRRSIHLAPTVSVSPWAAIEAKITKAAMSKTSVRSGACELSTKRARASTRRPGPEPGDEDPLGPPQAAAQDGDRPSQEQVTRMKAMRASALPSKPVTTISAPKRKKVTTWKIALTFSLKSAKASGQVAHHEAERHARYEGGDQAVAVGDLG